MKIALVHDYLVQDGGAERVLHAFHKTWPDAPIYVLFHDKNKFSQFKKAEIHQSFLHFLPFIKKRYRWVLPLMPIATEQYDLSNFDVVLSSTSAFAKGVITNPNTVHISYCHTPTRYLWTDTHDYIKNLKSNFLVKLLLPKLIHKLRIWDKQSADRVDYFIANSHTVQKRIKTFYQKESEVLYPSVICDDFYISEYVGDYFVTGGRLVQYKRFDLVIQTFNRLGLPLKIFGVGPEIKKLKKMSKSNIEFLGRISDKEKAKILSKAQAFIHPQEEDFGITPIESMASGTPVIAYAKGGATETVIDKKTGILFDTQNWESLFDIILHFDRSTFSSQEIKAYANKFDNKKFSNAIQKFVNEVNNNHKNNLKKTTKDLVSKYMV